MENKVRSNEDDKKKSFPASKRQKFSNFDGITAPSVNWSLLAISDQFQEEVGLKIEARLSPVNSKSIRCMEGMMNHFSSPANELIVVSQTVDTRGKSISVICGDLVTLDKGRWLSSDVINVLFRFLERREFRKYNLSILSSSSSEDYPKFNLFPDSYV